MNQNEYQKISNDAISDLKKAQARNTGLLIAFVLCVIGGLLYSRWEKSVNVDYIDGNVFRIARTGQATTGNVWNGDSFVTQLTWSGLFSTDANFTEVNPDLAKSYEVTPDGLTYTIVMNDNLKWSDGTALTAEDVQFSLEAFLLNNGVNNILTAAFSNILGVEQWQEDGLESWEKGGSDSLDGVSVNGNTITIELSTPYTSFAHALTQFIVLPKHALEKIDPSTISSGIDFFTDPICSGMYMVETTNSDGDLELVHNPHYYGTHSDIEKVILCGDYKNMHIDHYATTNITEMNSYRSIQGYQEFEVDVQFYRYFVFNLMAGFEQPEMVPQLDENGEEVLDDDGNVVLVASTELTEYDDDRPENLPMQDVLVRQAISLAIDRATLFKEVYFSTGSIEFSEAGSTAYSQFLQTYDPSKAKELLLASNYDLDRPLTIGFYHTDSNTTAFLSKVKTYLEEIGFTVIIKKTSGGVALYQQREYDMYLKAYPAYSTLEWFNEYLSTNDTLNGIIGTNEFDPLLKELDATTTPEDFNAVFTKIQTLDSENMYKLPLISLGEAAYINGNRVSVPDDMKFGCVRYRSDLRFDEWFIKKS